jgi:mRNA interferase HicA
MKRRELEKQLKKLGWSLCRRGAKHDIWAKGDGKLSVPRHREISERTAKAILKFARGE